MEPLSLDYFDMGDLDNYHKTCFSSLLKKRWESWLQNSAYTAGQLPPWLLWAAAGYLALVVNNW